MSVAADVAQGVCQGCCINPNWFCPPFTNDPLLYQPAQPNYLQQHTYTFPNFIDMSAGVKLTEDEKILLQKLVESYNLYTSLDKRSDADNREFVDAIHRLQQLVALRVARRVDPEVWAQPE